MATTTFELSNRLYALLVILLLSIVGGIAAGIWSAIGMASEYNSINVEGNATIEMAPDLATLRLGVNSEAKDSSAAMNKNTEIMNAVIAAIKETGLSEESIQTTGVQLNPSYDWQDGEYIETGYEATQTVKLKIRDFELIGEIISSASNAGANQMHGLAFELEDYEAELESAREEAIAEARAKAQSIAKSSGAKLGKLTSYYEYTNDGDRIGYAYEESAVMNMKAADMAIAEIAPGQEEVTLTVSLNYQVR